MMILWLKPNTHFLTMTLIKSHHRWCLIRIIYQHPMSLPQHLPRMQNWHVYAKVAHFFLDTPAIYRTFPRKSRIGQKHFQLYPHKRTWIPTMPTCRYREFSNRHVSGAPNLDIRVNSQNQKVPALGPTYIHYHLHVSVTPLASALKTPT